MNTKIFFAFALSFFSLAVFAQIKEQAEEQRKKDSIQLADVKREYPDNFRFNIAPVILTDRSEYVRGYMGGLRILDNTITDSIRRNYHADMPDTSSEIPYAALSVIGARVNVQFLQYGFFVPWGTTCKYSVELITDTKGIDKALLPFNNSGKFFSKRSVRISINGKPLFNWKNLTAFKRQLYKESSYEDESKGMYAYEYVFSLCDTAIGINDQLFIEIKEDSLNQMIDSYNITRKAAAPKVSAIFLPNQADSVIAYSDPAETSEKKTLH